MNISARIIALLALIVQLVIAALACNNPSRIDSIAYLYYRGIAIMLTSNGYYYVISEEEIKDKHNNVYKPTGRVPAPIHNCDATVLKDVDQCPSDHNNEHTIVCIKYISGELKYLSFNISAYLKYETNYWSPVKSLKSDLILSRSQIDYSKKIDSIFHTDANTEIYFIQGEYYSGIEWYERCPQTESHITVHEKRLLSDLNVFGRIDTAYYEEFSEQNAILYLFQYDHMQYYKVLIDRSKSGRGLLVPVSTTKHPISSHPIFSKICALDSSYNSSHLSAESSVNTVASHSALTTSKYSLLIHLIILFLILAFK